MVDTNDQWIMDRTGIRERHVLAKGLGVSDICVEAAKKCLAARGIAASEVECIIVGTVTPDMMFPSTACLVQDKIGAKGAWGFDVSAGCSGFVFALQAGVKMVESGAHKKVLVMRRGRQYAHDRLHRPDHLRAVWRRRRGGVD
jgi:3-oxoacyl-[acyl-carrier-protein] synthase-3